MEYKNIILKDYKFKNTSNSLLFEYVGCCKKINTITKKTKLKTQFNLGFPTNKYVRQVTNNIAKLDNLKIFFPDISGPANVAGDNISRLKMKIKIIFSSLNLKVKFLKNFL